MQLIKTSVLKSVDQLLSECNTNKIQPTNTGVLKSVDQLLSECNTNKMQPTNTGVLKSGACLSAKWKIYSSQIHGKVIVWVIICWQSVTRTRCSSVLQMC